MTGIDLFKLLDYGFAIFVGVVLLIAVIWALRRLVTSLQEQSKSIHTIMTNHLPHLHERMGEVGGRVDTLQHTCDTGFTSLQTTCEKGFSRVADALEKGLDRQSDMFTTVIQALHPNKD